MRSHSAYFPRFLLSGVLFATAAATAAAQIPAPAASPSPTAPAVPAAQLTVTPPGGPSEQSVRIEAKGLPANAQGILLGGQDPAALQEIGPFAVDTSGNLRIMAEIPGGSEYDRDYHFAFAVNGQTIAGGAYRVGSRAAPAN